MAKKLSTTKEVKAAVSKISKPIEKESAPVEPVPVEKEAEGNKGGIQKVGIIATIIESIKKNSLTKAEILAILVEKFPDRKADGMKSTVSIQLGSTRLGSKYDLKKDGDKYHIDG